jgi:release factor glutamine methyltransferase
VADVIIANLPYVDPEWERSKETDHEPASALFAENHGLALIFELLIQTKEKLALGGKLILEADPEQHPAIIKEAAKYGFVLSETRDYGLLLDKLR